MADKAIASRRHDTELAQVGDLIFEQYQAQPPAGKIESAEHIELIALDVNRQKIDGPRYTGLLRYLIQRAHRHFDDILRQRARRHAGTVERGHRPGDMESLGSPGLPGDKQVAATTRAPLGPQSLCEIWLWLDQHDIPAGQFEVPSLRLALRIVGANIHKVADAIPEEFQKEALFTFR